MVSWKKSVAITIGEQGLLLASRRVETMRLIDLQSWRGSMSASGRFLALLSGPCPDPLHWHHTVPQTMGRRPAIACPRGTRTMVCARKPNAVGRST